MSALATGPERPITLSGTSSYGTTLSRFTQVHPEWGHATNASAVIGKRALTKGLSLDRQTFMQSYDPYDDPEEKILEWILTAIGPVIAGVIEADFAVG